MFPHNNLEPQSQRWVRTVQDTIQRLEREQPNLGSQLDMLQREGSKSLADVSSNVNAYYTDTMQQYPAFQRTVPMREVLGGVSSTVAISAPSVASDTDAENWVTLLTHNLSIPFSVTSLGVRLNSAEFLLAGSPGYALRFRWVIGNTPEGMNITRWMNRLQFKLSSYAMFSTTPTQTRITNRYVHWTGGSAISTIQMRLQATIEQISNLNASVSSQSITLYAQDDNGSDTYLDVMVTV